MFARSFLIFVVGIAPALAQDRAAREQFEAWDKNGDGHLTPSELPEKPRRNFQRVDSNQDGMISREEHLQYLRQNRRSLIPENVRALRDIVYVEGGHERQKLDLYLPREETDAPRPVVLWIHGGGWRRGQRYPCPALFLTQKGYAVASIGYRLSDTATFPAQIHDCKVAIRFLRSRAKEYQLAPDRFGVWGSSAGGHLAALVGTSGNAHELEGQLAAVDGSSQVQAVCDYYGPTDLLQMAAQSGPNSRIDHDAADSPESKLVGGPLQERPDVAHRANPITYVDRLDPPFLIVHGDADPLVPDQQSRLLYDALQSVGVESHLTIVPGGGHGPFRDPAQLAAVEAFFNKILRAPAHKPAPDPDGRRRTNNGR